MLGAIPLIVPDSHLPVMKRAALIEKEKLKEKEKMEMEKYGEQLIKL